VSRRIRRREFLKTCSVGAGALAIPYIVPSHVWAGPSPNEVSVRAVVGTGGRGRGLMRSIRDRQVTGGDVRLAAICDVDEDRLGRALEECNDAGVEPDTYSDYRDVLDRDDIDVVYLGSPPHWHALMSIHAAQAGKDIYCEKPMTKFIHEGRAVVEAVARYGRVFHIGTFGRYGAGKWRRLVMSGRLGAPLFVRMNEHKYNFKVKQWSGRTNLVPEEPPPELDWNMWLGPAPEKPYHRHRCHGSFRGYWDYDGGGFTDMAAHFLDPVQYMLGKDYTGPEEIEATAPWPTHPDAVGMWESITYTYADGTVIRCNTGEWGESDSPDLPWIEGPKGKVMNDGTTDPPDLMDGLDDLAGPPKMLDYETALKVRQQPGGNAEVSHRVASLMHVGNLAIRLGRKLRWDPVAEEFVGDEEANRFVNVPMRAPWHL